MGAWRRRVIRHRVPVQLAADTLAWSGSVWFANASRYDFEPGHLATRHLAVFALLAGGLQIVFGMACSLYRGRYRFGSFEEVRGVLAAVASTAAVLTTANLLWRNGQPVPRTVPVAAGVLALTAMVGLRYGWRLFIERRRRPRSHGAEPLLLFGAGEGAEQVLTTILSDAQSRWYPVGMLDDDVRKRNLRLRGVSVLGGRGAMSRVAAATRATTLLVAIPTADAQLVREISELAGAAGLTVKVVPPVSELIHGKVGVEDIRDVDLTDLLGRRQITLDLHSIAGYLTGKRVLVTGAGGSIGSELCRQLGQYSPGELIMLDRDESALHAVQLSISGRALLDSDELVLADIRDIEQLARVFEARRPQVVFHAAALKHLTLLERHPGEAVKTNVWGTLAVLDAAKAAGVERFVNVSTDKAANPECVLGYSKRIAERLTAEMALEADGRYLSVRFGNVLGSRGSVLTAWSAQVAAGRPITVTHPEVTRYFMTVQEAVQLVIQAAAIGGDGEVLVLDMGQPVRIDDVARRMAGNGPRRVDVVYTGLRPGEKLHEDLLGSEERDRRPHHPLISQVRVPPLSTLAALALDAWTPVVDVAEQLRLLAASGPSRVPAAGPALPAARLRVDVASPHGAVLDQAGR